MLLSRSTMNQHSWLYSDSFLKRAFAIWGHYFVANLIIAAIAFSIAFLVAVTFGLNLAQIAPQNDGGVNVQVGR